MYPANLLMYAAAYTIELVLGDGVRRNIASVDPSERAMLKDAFIELNKRRFPGSRDDRPAPGGVTWWFKQDEIHHMCMVALNFCHGIVKL
jgi:hypothetical protein